MDHSRANLDAAHRCSTDHREELKRSEVCGCFYCLGTFVAAEIEEWIDDDDTALCPRCGVDARVGIRLSRWRSAVSRKDACTVVWLSGGKRPIADIAREFQSIQDAFMLALDDPRWSMLSHAYGAATDIPALLRTLASSTAPKPGYESEPWFSLWSSLCHQGEAYDASYAAVPHIVAIATSTSGSIDFSFFQLPAAIEIARQNRRAPAIPPELEAAYLSALASLPDCVVAHRNDDWDQSMLLSVFAAIAVSKGHFRAAEAIINLDGDLITKLIDLDFA